MLTKEKVLETVQSLPAEFSLDELVEHLIVLEKIERGLQQVEAGETKTMDEAKEAMKKWLQ
jgi:predicted transcriptional regulator